jgi:hypothetical protein
MNASMVPAGYLRDLMLGVEKNQRGDQKRLFGFQSFRKFGSKQKGFDSIVNLSMNRVLIYEITGPIF